MPRDDRPHLGPADDAATGSAWLDIAKLSLWEDRAPAPLPHGLDRYVWIVAEKELVRKANARFRDTLGVGPKEGYFAYYWEA